MVKKEKAQSSNMSKKQSLEQPPRKPPHLRIRELYKDNEDVILGSDDYDAYVYGGLSTGSLCVDMVIGRPGIPMGRLTEIAAEDDSGKTALALELVYQAQKKGMFIVICDTERVYDVLRLRERGIKPDDILFIRSDTLEHIFETVDNIIDNLHYEEECLVVIDSIAGTTTNQEKDSGYSDYRVGSHASVLAKAFRKIMTKICQNDPKDKQRKKVAMVLVNQLKENVNLSSYIQSNRLKHFGGFATKYHSSLRFTLKKKKIIYEDDAKTKPVAIDVEVYGHKNKLNTPYLRNTFLLNFAKGIDSLEDLFRAGVHMELITQKGAYYYYDEGAFYHSAWDKQVEKMGGEDEVRKLFTEKAFEMGYLKPYGSITA